MCLDSVFGGGGSAPTPNSGSSVVTNSLPPDVLARFNDLMDRGKTAADQPYQSYGGTRVAPFTGDQQSGFQMARDAAGSYQNDLNTARNYAGIAGQPIAPTVGTFDSSQMDRYGNPFNQQVIDATRNEINRSYDINGQGIAGNAAQAGAFGGDRSTIAQTENDRNRANSLATAIGSLNSQNFSQAQNQFNTEQNRSLAAQETDSANAARAAGQFQGIGAAGQSLGLQGASSLLGIGSQQQGQAQQQANVDYSNFLENRDWGKTQANFLSGIYHGFPVNSVGTQTITGPTPSILGQAGGAVAALGGSGAFGQQGWLTGSNGSSMFSNLGFRDGGGIAGYADGGTALLAPTSAASDTTAAAAPEKITHSGPPWLDDVGGIAGSLIGSIFFGPVGGMAGGQIGKKVGAGFGDLFDGNWDGLLNDAGVYDSTGNFNPMGAAKESMSGGGGKGGGMLASLFGGGAGAAGSSVGGFDAAGMGEMGLSAFARDGGGIKGYADDGYVDPNDVGDSRFYDPRYPNGAVRPDVWGVGANEVSPDYAPPEPLGPGETAWQPHLGGYARPQSPYDDQPNQMPIPSDYVPGRGYPEMQGPPGGIAGAPPPPAGGRAPWMAPWQGNPAVDPAAVGDRLAAARDRTMAGIATRASGAMSDRAPDGQYTPRPMTPLEQRMAADPAFREKYEPTGIAPGASGNDAYATAVARNQQQNGMPLIRPDSALPRNAEYEAAAAGRPIEEVQREIDSERVAAGQVPDSPGGVGGTSGAQAAELPEGGIAGAPVAGTGQRLEEGGNGYGIGSPDMRAPRVSIPTGPRGGSGSGPSAPEAGPSRSPSQPSTRPNTGGANPRQPQQGQNAAQPAPGQGTRVTGNGGIAGTPTAGTGTGGLGDASVAEQVTQRDMNAMRQRLGLPTASPTAATKSGGINLPLLMMGAAMMSSKSPSLMGSLGEGIQSYAGTKIAQDAAAAKNSLAMAHLQVSSQQHRERMAQMDVNSRRQYEYHLQQIEALKSSRADTVDERRTRDAQMAQHAQAMEQIARDNAEARNANGKTPEERADERADRAEATFQKTLPKDPVTGEVTPQGRWQLEDHIIRTQPNSTQAQAYKAALDSPQAVPGGPEARRKGQVYDTPKGALRWNGSGWVQP